MWVLVVRKAPFERRHLRGVMYACAVNERPQDRCSFERSRAIKDWQVPPVWTFPFGFLDDSPWWLLRWPELQSHQPETHSVRNGTPQDREGPLETAHTACRAS